MSPYVDPAEQLVVEVFVRSLARSLAFYRHLGFAVLREEPAFAELAWESHRFFLAELPDLPDPPAVVPANVRILVPNVDGYWSLVGELGARVVTPIGDRYYGLRDFTIADPDGFGLRFATRLH